MSLQFVVIAIGKVIPQSLQRGIYWTCFKLIRAGFKSRGFLVSPRNSLVTGNIHFGTSDIDLNLWFDSSIDWKVFYKTEKTIKKIIPIMGEINVLGGGTVESMLKFINPYLLEKDPLLISQLGLNQREGTSAEKLSYLLHCLNSNRGQLQEFPSQSKVKWTYYLAQVGLDLKEDPSFEVILNIIEKFNCDLDLEFLKRFTLNSDGEINQFYRSGEMKRELMCLYPTIWLGAADLYQSVESDINELVGNRAQLNLLVEGLKWELWGIYTQRFFRTREGLLTHLNKIKNLFEIISQTGHNDKVLHLIDGTAELLGIIKNGD